MFMIDSNLLLKGGGGLAVEFLKGSNFKSIDLWRQYVRIGREALFWPTIWWCRGKRYLERLWKASVTEISVTHPVRKRHRVYPSAVREVEPSTPCNSPKEEQDMSFDSPKEKPRISFNSPRYGSECILQQSGKGTVYILQQSEKGTMYILQQSERGTECILQYATLVVQVPDPTTFSTGTCIRLVEYVPWDYCTLATTLQAPNCELSWATSGWYMQKWDPAHVDSSNLFLCGFLTQRDLVGMRPKHIRARWRRTRARISWPKPLLRWPRGLPLLSPTTRAAPRPQPSSALHTFVHRVIHDSALRGAQINSEIYLGIEE